MASAASKGRKLPCLIAVVVGLRFEDPAGKKELLGELLVPLLAQIGRRDHQNAPLAFGPSLRKHQSGLDGLAQADLVGQQGPFRERRIKREQGSFDLMGVQIDLALATTPRRASPCYRMSIAWSAHERSTGVVVGQLHSVFAIINRDAVPMNPKLMHWPCFSRFIYPWVAFMLLSLLLGAKPGSATPYFKPMEMLLLKQFYLPCVENRFMKHFVHFSLYHFSSGRAGYEFLSPFLQSVSSSRFPISFILALSVAGLRGWRMAMKTALTRNARKVWARHILPILLPSPGGYVQTAA